MPHHTHYLNVDFSMLPKSGDMQTFQGYESVMNVQLVDGVRSHCMSTTRREAADRRSTRQKVKLVQLLCIQVERDHFCRSKNW
jgi:hypothetical protein